MTNNWKKEFKTGFKNNIPDKQYLLLEKFIETTLNLQKRDTMVRVMNKIDADWTNGARAEVTMNDLDTGDIRMVKYEELIDLIKYD